MQVTIKTLQQHTFAIDIDGSETVKTLKQKIENERGKDSYPVAGQKLIYAGKILDDNKVLSDYKIEESKFIVAMVTKVKSTPKPTEKTSKPSTPTEASSSSTPAEATPKPDEKPSETPPPSSESTTTAAAEPTPPATAPSEQPSVTASQGALVTNEDYEATVRNILDLGFPREQVEAALRASFNNPDRAVEYLMGEIPPAVAAAAPASQNQPRQAPAGEAPPSAPAAAPDAQNPAAPGGEGMASSLAEVIQRNPQLQELVNQVRTQPQLLPAYMETIGQQNPQLLRFISEHQQDFVNYINNPNQNQPAAGADAEGQGVNYITVTPRERQEIDELKAMGFSEMDCLQAYMACGKDMALAINLLLNE